MVNETSNEGETKTEPEIPEDNQIKEELLNKSSELIQEKNVIDQTIADQSLANYTLVDSPENNTEIITLLKYNDYNF